MSWCVFLLPLNCFIPGGEEVRRPAVAGAAGLLQARFGPSVSPPGVVPLPAHVQGHQGESRLLFLLVVLIPSPRFGHGQPAC